MHYQEINNINLSVIHAWRKGNFKSVFRIKCTKILINFIILYYLILCMTKQETQSEQVAVEKNQDQKGKWQNFIIMYEY